MYITIGFTLSLIIVAIYACFNILALSSIVGLAILRIVNVERYKSYKEKIESRLSASFDLSDAFEGYMLCTLISILVSLIGTFAFTFLWLPLIIGMCIMFVVLNLLEK